MHTVAVQLRCSRRHLERLLASHRIPAPVRIGRLVRWRADEIVAWIHANCPDRAGWERIKARGPEHGQ